MASTPAVAVYVHAATPYTPVPAPSTHSRERRHTANDDQPTGSPRTWRDTWGPTILVLTFNLLVLLAPAGYAVGVFFERMNTVQSNISTLQTTTESIRKDVEALKVTYGRVDERLTNLQRTADRQATTVEPLNNPVQNMATNPK